MRFQTAVIITPLVLFTLAVASWAHKLSVFAWVEGDTLIVEAQFRKGRPVVNGNVLIYDGNDQLLTTALTNTGGIVRLTLPDYSTGLKIVVNGGEQHQSFWIMTPSDIEKPRQ